jgi:hypothetical protein
MTAPASRMETYHGVWKVEPRRVVSCPSVEVVARAVLEAPRPGPPRLRADVLRRAPSETAEAG